MLVELPTYGIGDAVESCTDDCTVRGVVRGCFYTTSQKLRYVVEIPPGVMMIYPQADLHIPPDPSLEPELFDAAQTGAFSIYDLQEHQDGDESWQAE